MNNLSHFEIGTVIAVLIAVLTGGLWLGALTTKVEFLHEDYGAVKEEREKTINEIQSQKEIILAEIQKAKQPALNGSQIKAFETELIKVETRITKVQQRLDTLQIAELQTQVAGVEEKLNQLNQTLSGLKAKMAKGSQQALTDIKSQTEQTLAKIQLSKQQALSEFKAIQQDIEALNVNGLKTNLAQVKNELNVLNQAVETLKVAPRQVEPKKVATKVEPNGRHRLKIGGYGPEMVTIPAGRFEMGSKHDSDEKPIHEVSIKTFAMSRYEITFAEYDAFAKATGRTKPKDSGWGRGNRPVINVSWHDAVAYTKWLTEQTGQEYRLPTEAEWEYAARAGTEANYWWGNGIGKNRANCDGCGSRWDDKSTSPVGSFEANPFGLYDTAGNVWEWCADNWHDNYEGAPTDGGVWKGGNKSRRVLRGGSWSGSPGNCRSANRLRGTSVSRLQVVGFRVAVAVRLQ